MRTLNLIPHMISTDSTKHFRVELSNIIGTKHVESPDSIQYHDQTHRNRSFSLRSQWQLGGGRATKVQHVTDRAAVGASLHCHKPEQRLKYYGCHPIVPWIQHKSS